MSWQRGQKRNNLFVQTSFDTTTHLPIKRSRIGPGRQGRLTEEGLKALNEVKRAGGQCVRCKELKKKAGDTFPTVRIARSILLFDITVSFKHAEELFSING